MKCFVLSVLYNIINSVHIYLKLTIQVKKYFFKTILHFNIKQFLTIIRARNKPVPNHQKKVLEATDQ